MKYLKIKWQSRVMIILLVSVFISCLLVFLDRTDWAAQINQQGYSHGGEGGKPSIPMVLIYILPFVKEIVLMGVPMLLTLLVINIAVRIKAKLRKISR